jgi:hypothetical protein
MRYQARELGSHPAYRAWQRRADARLEPVVRVEHARRRAVAPDEGWTDGSRYDRAGLHRSIRAARRRGRTRRPERGGHINYYVAGTLFSEDGWRDDWPSDVRQIFGKVGWRKDNDTPSRCRWRTPTTRSMATVSRPSSCSRTTTTASTRSLTTPRTGRRSSTSMRAGV